MTQVTIKTSVGEINLELDYQKAPVTVKISKLILPTQVILKEQFSTELSMIFYDSRRRLKCRHEQQV